MAFLKYANATVIKPHISMPDWDALRSQAVAMGSPFHQRRANNVVLQKYQPDQFLLSHCTIIASVDTENAGLPLGRQMNDGFQIDRQFDDYLVTPQTNQFINNNNDCWERKLLLACFRTFVGGENYVEHLQIPELSKGKIIDAAARDIGESVYVDILVATDLKHKPLISAVQSRQLSTLSMGCQVAFTQCTKCCNVAEDETNLCPHIRFMKGNTYTDGLGKTRKIAELCGHINSEPGSVKFIEASWVANPAFTGAVLRNILTPDEVALLGDRIQVAFSEPPRTPGQNAMYRAAKLLGQSPKRAFAFGDDEGGGEEEFPGAGDEGPKEEANPLDSAIGEMADYIRQKAVERVRGEMAVKDVAPRADMDENRNDTMVKEAIRQSPVWRELAKTVMARVRDPKIARRMMAGLILHKRGGWGAVREVQLSGRESLALSRLLDGFSGTRIAGEARIYRTVTAVGGLAPYANENSYLAACRRAVGRTLTGSEQDALIAKGRIFDLGAS